MYADSNNEFVSLNRTPANAYEGLIPSNPKFGGRGVPVS